MAHLEITRGDVVCVDLRGAEGNEKQRTRPCLVIQNDIGNQHSPLTIVAAITDQRQNKHLPSKSRSRPQNLAGRQGLNYRARPHPDDRPRTAHRAQARSRKRCHHEEGRRGDQGELGSRVIFSLTHAADGITRRCYPAPTDSLMPGPTSGAGAHAPPPVGRLAKATDPPLLPYQSMPRA
jgi:hypothetical protein